MKWIGKFSDRSIISFQDLCYRERKRKRERERERERGGEREGKLVGKRMREREYSVPRVLN